MGDNESTIYPYVRAAMKAVLRRKFIAINAYIKKKDLKSVTLQLKKLGKE